MIYLLLHIDRIFIFGCPGEAKQSKPLIVQTIRVAPLLLVVAELLLVVPLPDSYQLLQVQALEPSEIPSKESDGTLPNQPKQLRHLPVVLLAVQDQFKLALLLLRLLLLSNKAISSQKKNSIHLLPLVFVLRPPVYIPLVQEQLISLQIRL